MPKQSAQIDKASERRPKAYSYIRMSTPEQLKGDSLRRQLARTRHYAEANSLELIDSFDDLGVSGYRGQNGELGALARFKALVEQGDIEKESFLIVESMDRLSRQKVMDAFLQLASIVKSGITLVTLDDNQVYSKQTIDAESIKLYIALGAMARAHEESRRKSDLLSHTWIEKRRRLRESGVVLTRRVPAWLSADQVRNEITVIPERAEIVREIFAMTRDGYGTYSIAHRFNKLGMRPWSTRKNAVWRESYIKKILLSRAVLGEFQPHTQRVDENRKGTLVPDGESIPDYYPAIISHQLFQEAASAIDTRRRKGKGRKGKSYANLFTGVLRCHCSAGMRYVNKGPMPKGGTYLRCSVALAGGGCKARAFRYPIIEERILHAIETLDVSKVMGGQTRRQRLAEIEHERSMLQVDLDGVDKKEDRILHAIKTMDGIHVGALTNELHKLEKQKRELRLGIDSINLEINELLTINPAARKQVIAELLEHVRLDSGPEEAEKTRRALASELLRLIDKITIKPMSFHSYEIIDADPRWRDAYGVASEKELDDLLHLHGYNMSIKYRNGDVQLIDGISSKPIKFRESTGMKKLKLRASESALDTEDH